MATLLQPQNPYGVSTTIGLAAKLVTASGTLLLIPLREVPRIQNRCTPKAALQGWCSE